MLTNEKHADGQAADVHVHGGFAALEVYIFIKK